MKSGRSAHYVPRVKDLYKREVSFSLLPSNLGKKGKRCSYSARLKHNQVLDEDAAVSEMCEEFTEDKKGMVDGVWLEDASGRTVAEATIIKCDAARMDLRFDGEIAPGPYQIVLRRMNEGGKSYTLARLKVEMVAA